jgi:hypothetical protein
MTPTARPTQSDDTRRCPPPPPFDIHTMEPIEPPWQAIKEWIPDDEPDFDWSNRPRDPPNPDPDGFDQRVLRNLTASAIQKAWRLLRDGF